MAELEELVGTIGDAGGSNVKGMRAKADLVALREEAEIANKVRLMFFVSLLFVVVAAYPLFIVYFS